MDLISDASTETGLRVKIYSPATGTAVQLVGEEWEELKRQIQAGEHDDLAKEPRIPFVHWPERGEK